MRISKVSIRNYRCIEALDLDIDDYTVLVGANGAGKSSVLYALNWFFNGGPIGTEDVHEPLDGTPGSTPDDATAEHTGALEDGSGQAADREVSVEVTFRGLTDADRAELERYGHGEHALFRRTWDPASGNEKIVGNARQGPGFAAVRSAGGAADTREAYNALRTSRDELNLPAETTKKGILAALDEWEGAPGNAGRLEPIENSDATHMFGVQGEHRLERRVRFVLIPAAADIATEVGATGRGSTLSRLVGGLVAAAVTDARETWTGKNQTVLDELTDAISSGVSGATSAHAVRVNQRLAEMLPSAAISIEPQMPEWTPKIDPSLSTHVTLDGRTHDVSRQGHGVQRAVMIAMLQALVPHDPPPDGAEEDDAPPASDEVPTFIVAVEEPEIYQHPVRARHLARALMNLGGSDHHQVLLATHSPYFVRPEQFAGLRRITMTEGRSSCTQTTPEQIAAASGAKLAAVRKRLEQELPRTFSEGFFAEAAILVEGDTDKVLLETLSERLDLPLDAAGVAVLVVGGKGSMRLAVELLECLGTPTFVLVDGDARGYTDDGTSGSTQTQDAHGSHRAETERAIEWLEPRRTSTLLGPPSATFGGATAISNCFCVLQDDIETELAGWASYQAELASQGVSARAKSVSAYRAAASHASTDDLPVVFETIVRAAIARRGI